MVGRVVNWDVLGGALMTKEALEKRISEIKYRIFIEEMADFMDWGAYYRLRGELKKAEEELAALAA